MRWPAKRKGDWEPDGLEHPVKLARGQAVVRIEDHAGRINPALAPAVVLSALVEQLGVDSQTAQRIGTAMVEWRGGGANRVAQYRSAGLLFAPPGSAYQTIDEIGLVIGMTPELLRRTAPFLSLYAPSTPDLARAHPIVASTIEAAGGRLVELQGTPDRTRAFVAEIFVRATLADATFTRRVTVRIDPTDEESLRPWQILNWR